MLNRIPAFSKLTVLAIALLPATAYASGGTVVDGATVRYAGTLTNKNEVELDYGDVILASESSTTKVNTVTIDLTATHAPLNFGCGSGTGGSTPKFSATTWTPYYVYYVNNGAGYVWHISTIAPFHDGYNSGLNYIDPSSGSCDSQSPSGDNVYLGSFVTDGSKNVVPFRRKGNDVILDYGGVGFESFQNAPASNSLTINHTTQTLSAQAFLTPGGLSMPAFWFPESASAAIVDVMITNNVSGYVNLWFNDPTFSVDSTLSRVDDQVQFGIWPSANIFQRIQLTLDSNDNFSVQSYIVSTITGSVSPQLIFRGYVEDVQHLDF